MNNQIAALVNMEMLTIHFVSHETFVILKKVERKAKTFLFFWGEVWRLLGGRRVCAQIPRKFKVREWRGWICQRRRVEGDVWKRKSKSLFTGV